MTQKMTPADKLYKEGIPLNTERIIQHADIDISHPITAPIKRRHGEMDEETRSATMSAVCHYHYVKTSNVLLCDDILDRKNVPEPARRAARILLKRNAEELQAWSDYIDEEKMCGPMSDVQREYYYVIWNQDSTFAALLGVQHMSFAADASYKRFQNNDSVFQQLTKELVKQNEAVYPAVNDALFEAISGKGRRERVQILRQVAQQIDLIQLIARQPNNKEVFTALGTSGTKLMYSAAKDIKTFYKEIGLTPGIF